MAKRGRKCFSVGQIIKSQWFKPWTHGRRSIEKWSFRTRKSVPWNWLGCEIGELKTPAKIVPCFFRGKNFTENEPCSGDVSIVQYSFDACSSDVLMSWTTLGFFNQSTASGKKSTSFHVFFFQVFWQFHAFLQFELLWHVNHIQTSHQPMKLLWPL